MFMYTIYERNREISTKGGFTTREEAVSAAEKEIENGQTAQVMRKLK